MPHATEDNMSTSITNGDKPSSKFLSHATSYPVVNDSIEAYKSHPYGKKSLEIADGAYQKYAKPVASHLEGPYSYVAPYVAKADEIADAGLGKVETHFPIVKEETGTIVETAKGYAFWPYKYLSTTWSDEYQKTAQHNDRGYGITTAALALISTELKLASDFFQAVANILGPKYEESKKKGVDYVRHAQDTAQNYKQVGQDKFNDYKQAGQENFNAYKQVGQDKINDYTKFGQQKADEYTQSSQQTASDLKGDAEQKKESAKGQVQGATEEAKKKAQK